MTEFDRRTGGPRPSVGVWLCIGAACCLAVLAFLRWRPEASPHGPGLFSWHSEVLEGERRDALFDRMEGLGLTELYQHISRETGAETVRAFTEAASARGIAVYLLAGDPVWGLDASGRAMREAVGRAAGYGGLRGVVMDVEPYLTEDWEDDPDGTMASYVQAMVEAKGAAEAAGLELVACIPYFYDTTGQGDALETLVARGCDALAVMNYYRGKEADHLETEAALADARGRPLITIYELQAPGRHGLTERNTYHGEGLDALAESWEALRRAYPDTRLSYALHDETALKEVLGK